MHRLKEIYDALPVPAQALAANLVSAINFRKKYGGGFRRALHDLERNEHVSSEAARDQQKERLRALLAYARRHVPYYRSLACPEDDIRAWPILERATIAASPDQFLSEALSRRPLLSLATSGTTGTPLTVRFAPETHRLEMAFRWRHRAWGGVPFLSRGAYLAGHPVVPPTQLRPPFWRLDLVEGRLLLSSYHLTEANLPHYADALRRFAPDFVHGYPSSLYLLARWILHSAADPPRPKAVFTASETLLDFQRSAIEAAFGAKVFNWYGNSELTCNVVECASGRLHQRTDYGYLEVLEDGTMLCTGLNNLAMPLIRYRVGDRAELASGGCPCGSPFPVVERIEGRIEEYVCTPDGRYVGRLDHLFKRARFVREAQLVQERLDELIIRIVPEQGYSESEERAIQCEARQRLGDAIRLRFEYVPSIPRSASGKFRFIASLLNRRSAAPNGSSHGYPE